MEQITDFKVRKDHWVTPVGTFEYHGDAAAACKRVDMLPELCIKHEIEMCKVTELVKAIGDYLKPFAAEFESLDYITVSPAIKYDSPDILVPVERFHMIAYAVEGSNEGNYVHFGCIMRAKYSKETPGYVDFGFAKLFSRDEAERLAIKVQRFLSATDWN